MQWIENIECVDGKFLASYVASDQTRFLAGLGRFSTAMPRLNNQVAKAESYSLEALRLADSNEYLSAFGLSSTHPGRHQVFELDVSGRRTLVPTVVLLHGVIGHLTSLSELMLRPTSLECIGTPILDGAAPQFGYHHFPPVRKVRKSKQLTQRLIWLSCHASARRFWDSIYRHALESVLGMTPPKAVVDATFYGKVHCGTAIAVRMNLNSLTPTEAALPFASKFAPNDFKLDFRSDARARNLIEFRNTGAKSKPPCKQQHDIPRGPTGYRTTDAEWRELQGYLQAQRIWVKSKTSIDIALEKLGLGIPWQQYGPTGLAACQRIYGLQKQGRWQMILYALQIIRRQPS